jgi:hypothetical protein
MSDGRKRLSGFACMYVLLLLLFNHRTTSTITRTRIDINRRTQSIARLIFIRKILCTSK